MLSLIMFHISLVFDYTMSVLVSLESGFYFMTYGRLDIVLRSVLIYLFQLMFGVCLSKSKIIWHIGR
jgi:hypothetical protein